jgi:hypothetical protein
MFEGLTKKLGQKKQKKNKYFPLVPGTRHSGKRSPSPSARSRLSGKSFSNFFKRLRLFAPSNAHFLFRVPFFPECNSSPSATLGEDCLPRVPDFWHSGKYVALGEYCFSRSGSLLSIPRNVVISESGVVADSGNSWMVPVFVLDSQ